MNFDTALHFRHACKVFDKDKKIDSKILDKIIEAGRLAPSSMGMQPWKFLLIQNIELKNRLKEACWNQSQITDCSELIVVLARTNSLLYDSEYVKEIISQRKDKSKEEQENYKLRYKNFIIDNIGTSKKELFAWSKAQCFLSAYSMMMQAAINGVDSCPIEGFEIDKVKDILDLENSEFEIALIICFGYRKNPQTDKFRLSRDKILTIIK